MRVLDGLARDLRFGTRMLVRSPAFTMSAVLALGLGIGASTTIFSLIDGIVLRPLPYRDPDRLVMLWETNRERSLNHEPISPVNFVDYRGLTQVFEDAAAWWKPVINLTEPDRDPIRVTTIEVSSNFFSVVGVQPALGRAFPATPIYADVYEAIISDRLWRTRFDADPAIVGSSVRLNGRMFTVLGVMPPGFALPGETDVWQRLRWDLAQHSRAAHFMESVVRLKPGISNRQADNELRALTDRLGRDFPVTNRGWNARTVPLQQEVVGFFRLALFAVFGAAGLLLLVACFNVANLLLARATLRAPEVAVRTAIGASRARLVRQFLTESALLAVAGTALGVVMALVAIRLVVVASPIAIPRLGGVGIDVRALLFAASTTGLTSLVFGIVPALALARGDVTGSLKGSRTTAHGHRTLSVLVVAEVALAVVLLCGAGLLVRTVRNLTAERPGFAPDSLFTTNLELPYTYSDWSRISRFYTDLADELRRRPGIDASGSSAFLPLATGWRMRFLIGGQPQPPPGEEPIAQTHIVDEGYFACLRVPLIDGRAFDARDTAERPGAVVINQAMAQRYWPDQRAIGQSINYGGKYMQIGPLGRTLVKELHFEVIGIVGDVKNTALEAAPEPAIYFTVRQFSYRNLNIVVRGSAPPAALDSTVRAAVRQMDPDLPLSGMRSMGRVLAASVDPTRMLMALMAAFAVLAVLLAGIGLYGILAYAVGQRRRELSVRLALGAEPASLRSMVIGHGLRLVGAGCLAGAAGAYGVGRALSGFLFGVAPSDVQTIGGVMVILIVVGLAASARPAQRAAAIDPLEGLRSE